MTTGQKISISFFSTLLIFALTVLLSQTGVFSQIEKSMFSQIKVQEEQKYLTGISDASDEYIDTILKTICTDEKAYLQNLYIESYLKADPSEAETSNRRRITENLFYQLEGLEGIRLIDDKQNVWFSTFYDTDLTNNAENHDKQNYLRYKNYNEISKSEKILSYEVLCKNLVKEMTPEIILDGTRNQMVFCVKYEPENMMQHLDAVKNGVFVFYFDINDFETYLLKNRYLNFGERLIPVSTAKNPDLYGFVVSQNSEPLQDVKNAVLYAWNNTNDLNHYRMENIFEEENGNILVMLSVPSAGKKMRISGIYDSSVFTIPHEIVILIYICLFVSLLLVIFLILSLKSDYSITIKNRIKHLQYEIISQYLNDKTDVDWAVVARQLEIKKSVFSSDIKKSFGKKGEKYSSQIDAVLEKSWNEIISVLKSSNNSSGESELLKEIKNMLTDIISKSSSSNKTEILNVPYELDEEKNSETKTKEDGFGDKNIKETDVEQILFSPDEQPENNQESYKNEAMVQISEKVPVNDNNDEYLEAEEIETIDDAEELKSSDESDDLEEIETIEEIAAEGEEEPEDLVDLEDAEEVQENCEVEEVTVPEKRTSVEKFEGAHIRYLESNDTYVSLKTDDFPNVDNIFAEELCYGGEYAAEKDSSSDKMNFEIIMPVFKFGNKNKTEEQEKNEPLVGQQIEKSDGIQKEIQLEPETEFTESENKITEITETVNELENEVETSIEAEPKTTAVTDLEALINIEEENIAAIEPENEPEEITENSEESEKEVETESEAETEPENQNEVQENIEEISSLNHESCYSLVSFACEANVCAISKEKEDSIIEKDGVYSISQDIEFTDIIQDENFKSLVDSILK